ncbi:hypothetical protein [Pseudomonas sp. NPDC008258]|uniref:hypothetical protein n=1 Tax=Pseudomonas sp. NPDC008258 TaxID=3364418 RepID=UPI0036F0E8B1
MRMKPIPACTSQDELDKVVQLKISEHQKYQELYTLIQTERFTRGRIETLMLELGLKNCTDYRQIPISPLDLIRASLSNESQDNKDGAKDSSINAAKSKACSTPKT